MNKTKLIELLEDGATFDSLQNKFYHSSFRKGWRKVCAHDISWLAVEREHGEWKTNRLQKNDSGLYFLETV